MPEPAWPAQDACGPARPRPRRPATAASLESAVQPARSRPTRTAGHNRNGLQTRASRSSGWEGVRTKQYIFGWMRASRKGSGPLTLWVGRKPMSTPSKVIHHGGTEDTEFLIFIEPSL